MIVITSRIKKLVIVLIIYPFVSLLIGQSIPNNIELGYSINLVDDVHSIICEDGKKYINNGLLSPTQPYENSTFKIHTSSINRNSFILTVRANFIMDYVWLYNKSESEGDTLVIVEDSSLTITRPEGIYLLFAGKFDTTFQHTLITKDSIELYLPIEVQLFREDAKNSMQFVLFKETSTALFKSVITFYFYSRLNKPGLSISNFGAGSVPFILNYNKIPPYFDQEWAVKGKQLHNDGNLYLVSGELKTTQADTTIMNDPSNLAYADFHYHYPDSLHVSHYFQISTLFPDFHLTGSGDPIYTHPFQVRIYQDTTASIGLRSSTFIQFLNSNAISYIATQEIKIGFGGVTGYFLSDRGAQSYKISEQGESTHLGLLPVYWFGKFFNNSDTIKIRSPHGRFDHLFLSQTNDALLHYDVDYQIFSNGIPVKTGNFPYAAGGPFMFLGFNPDSLTIPISPETYEMVITDNHYELFGEPGISQVRAFFNLNLPDKNPPNIILFQIQSNNELANLIDPENNNWIRFVLEEDENLDIVQLFYSIWNDTIWHEISVNYDDPYWVGHIPFLSEGFYSLKLIVSDNTQNYIDCLIEPAFLIEESVGLPGKSNHINENYAELIPFCSNYPNPFNSGTIISYKIPDENFGEIQIVIYNVLGQKITTIFSGRTSPGIHQLRWEGFDCHGNEVPSGIYLLILKGGGRIIKQKMLLIH